MPTAIYHNATVFTANPEASSAEAFAVTGGRFEAIGTLPEVRSAVHATGRNVVEIDLEGSFVTPGFIDSHTHLTTFGETLSKAQLRDCKNLDEIQQRLLQHRRRNPNAARVLGASWLFDAVGDQHPTKTMLDEVFPDVPVYCDANDLHSVWVNSAALRELGIDRDSPDPVGGRIGRDSDGEATGMLYETAGRQYAGDFLQKAQTLQDRISFLEQAFQAYVESGVTGATDMALTPPDVEAMSALVARDGRLPFPITGHMLLEPSGNIDQDLTSLAEIIELRHRIAESGQSEWFRIAGIKFIMDGVIDARTATMRSCYADGSNCAPIWAPEQLLPIAQAADAEGLQIALHAIGDRTSEIAVDTLEQCSHTGRPHSRRHRIEHLEIVTDSTISRMAAIGVTASMQPVHCDPAIMDNWKAVLGDERQEEGFPWQKFRAAGVPLTLGTDAPTAPHEAIANLYIALTGGSSLEPSLPAYHPERAFSPEEALTALTAGGAYAGETEDAHGSIQPGLLANFTVLDLNLLDAEPQQILTARVLSTYVLGEKLFAAEHVEAM